MGSSNMLPLVQAYLCRVPAAMQRARCGKIIDRNIGGRVPKSRGGPHVAARPRRSRLWLVFDPCLYVDFLLLCVDGGNETNILARRECALAYHAHARLPFRYCSLRQQIFQVSLHVWTLGSEVGGSSREGNGIPIIRAQPPPNFRFTLKDNDIDFEIVTDCLGTYRTYHIWD